MWSVTAYWQMLRRCWNCRLISQGEAEDLLHIKVHALAPVYPYLAIVDIRYEGEVALYQYLYLV
jgi:hypothetical protein